MRNIYIGICLSPYRVDLCNNLYTDYDFDIYHLFEEGTAGISSDLLYAKAVFPKRFIPGGKTLGFKGFRLLWKIMKENRPEIVFTPEFSIVTICAVLIRFLLGLKGRIVSVCDDSIDMIDGNDFTFAHRIGRRFVPHLVDDIFSSDKEACSWYRKHYGKGVYFPVIANETVFRARLEDALPLSFENERKYGLAHRKTVLYIGRLVSVKRAGDLIRAYASVKAPDNVLVIVGDGEQMQELRELDRELGTGAVFTGLLEGDELLSWYNIADVHVLPSVREPFGAVVNEALLAGCPSVLSHKCGARTIVEPGVNGVVFEAGNVADLSDKLRLVLDKVPLKETLSVRESLMGIRFCQALDEAMLKIKGDS
ncbi:MAG: glycosyltransferase family 4 protein [Bacteroidales bacterium]|nr:glycosyltransferase family 4 protein [Bacteroidales bacterium]